MPPKRIRLYELARELGLSNKEALDLCERLRIGVKSHSSSVEDAQADRVRRLVDAEGLRRDPIVDEPKPKRGAKAAAEAELAAEPLAQAPSPIEQGDEPLASDPEAAPAAHRVVRSTEGASRPVAPPVSEAPIAPLAPPRPPMPLRTPAPISRPASAAPTPAAPSQPEPIALTPSAPAPPASAPSATPQESTDATPLAADVAGELTAAEQASPADSYADATDQAESASGLSVPQSLSGRSIPPPPGLGGRRVPPPPPPRGPQGTPGASGTGSGAARPGGPGGPAGSGAGGPRPSPGRFSTGAPRGTPGRPGAPGAAPGAGPPPGRGGPPGGPPGRGGFGAPGAPGGRGRPGPHLRPRRKKKRRRFEELEPQSMPSYTPSDAPVPEGEIAVPRGSTIQELATKLNRTSADLVRMLMTAGEMVTATQSLSDDMIELIAQELGAEILIVEPGQEAELELQALLGEDDDDDSLLERRPPIVTVMGHVDHGKTKLLDRIRSANVVAGEAGGITQHIGAYRAHHDGREVTFIDTPGHEAFTAMRARGAQATDIAVLVVAADDGVMPQTIEALEHAKAAEVPIIVAINKVDKEDADVTRVRQQLSEHGLVPEEWGGDTMMVEVSALEGTGIDGLLDSILLLAEVEDLVANPKAPARGLVLEANLDSGRGPVATMLVERGTLRVGDPVVAGGAWGRVRAMLDESGKPVAEAGPSVPVLVLGLDNVPLAGDELRVAPDDRTARIVGEARARRRRQASLVGGTNFTGGSGLEDIFAHIQRGELATLNLILKADVQGSLEALTESLKKLERDDVKLAFVSRAVGGINESDVNLAVVSNATIIGFNVRPDRKAREVARQERVDVRLYEVIYKVLEDAGAAMLGMLKPEFEEVVTGEAEVREVFGVPRVGKVAGCYVRDGVITRGSKVRFLREGVVIWNGQIASLKRFKEDAREVQSGFECGIGLENFQDLKPGDTIETYELTEIPRT